QGWFRVSEPEPGVFAIEEPLHAERVASFLIVGTQRALLVDAGMGVGDLPALIATLTDRPVTLLVSHAHFDHVGSAHRFAGRAPILVHPLEADRLRAGMEAAQIAQFFEPKQLSGRLPEGFSTEGFAIPGVEPTGFAVDGDAIDLGGRAIEIIEAPGHAPGLLALLDRSSGALFTTDAYYDGPLYAHLPGADLVAYRATMRRLAARAPEVSYLDPSHNERPLPPARLEAAAAAFDELAAGRAPDAMEDGAACYEYGDFSILTSVGDGGAA
ncbi:MAG: MBL fold metallo-hydrolase, partial [Thermomicrobiales bacterium]|nr:MBL fold metallo-hydrolase [Thermomicrobiales bacterium]